MFWPSLRPSVSHTLKQPSVSPHKQRYTADKLFHCTNAKHVGAVVIGSLLISRQFSIGTHNNNNNTCAYLCTKFDDSIASNLPKMKEDPSR